MLILWQGGAWAAPLPALGARRSLLGRTQMPHPDLYWLIDVVCSRCGYLNRPQRGQRGCKHAARRVWLPRRAAAGFVLLAVHRGSLIKAMIALPAP